METTLSTITLANLRPPPGAKHARKRLGRGRGTGQGTTAGRGQKGQGSRSGPDLGRGFEGGQMPLQRRLPKRGFKNPFRIAYTPVNLEQLAEIFENGDAVDLDILKSRGMIRKNAQRIKILGRGDLPIALTIRAHAFSETAVEKITESGGKIERVPLSPPKDVEPRQPS